VNFVKGQGAFPFIIPAMGSHGGATAKGQKEVLAGYGITENTMGAPVRSSMETVEITDGTGSNRIFMDKFTYESDGVILINKIKPHTDFHSTYESGLVKMAVIGLGKERGAEAIHNFGVWGLTNLIPQTAKVIFETGKILAGIALIENAYDKTMLVQAIPGNKIMSEEIKLIDIARSNRPKLPTDNIDVLLIDRMGKNISGVGIDTNIIGRIKIYGQPEPEKPKIKSIAVYDLTDESHGNATGIGLADLITRKVFNKIDFEKTYKNISTSSFLERGKIPFIAENDLEAFELALRNCGNSLPGNERIIRIKDTLHLDELYVSDAILNEIKDNPQIETEGEKVNIFNSDRTLISF
ncbi:MAG: DUF2088 domain-containing protein, partial [Prolixibacteraceae bacterium]|nr:DUF2088 domain-containing protein [Prolixibacteraceae bacterium]